MDDDERGMDEQKKIIDLRGVSPPTQAGVGEDEGGDDLPPRPQADPSKLRVYRKTEFGDIPVEGYDAMEGMLLGDVGIGKLLIVGGLALLGVGVMFELMDRAENLKKSETSQKGGEAPES